MAPVLTHLALHVRDLEACVDFYQDYCGLAEVHQRGADDARLTWLAESGRARELVLVLIEGGPGREQAAGDFSHLGFALASRAAIDAVAAKAKTAERLVWRPRDEPFPVGYWCGVRDPDGNMVEFSHGQPLGPGAPDLGARDLRDPPDS